MEQLDEGKSAMASQFIGQVAKSWEMGVVVDPQFALPSLAGFGDVGRGGGDDPEPSVSSMREPAGFLVREASILVALFVGQGGQRAAVANGTVATGKGERRQHVVHTSPSCRGA